MEQVQPTEQLYGPFEVSKVTDGDTIHVLVDGQDLKVRIIGIDTPETVAPNQSVGCFGPEASAFALNALGDSSVYLEYDSSPGEFDRYHRTLAHVWTSDKKLYASQAILAGYGVERTYAANYHHRDLLMSNQTEAQRNNSGLWSVCH